VEEGYVATKIKSVHGLLGHPLLSCASVEYVYEEEHHLTAAILLNAQRPGMTPPALPGMVALRGHSGLFEAPGAMGRLVARRVSDAWIVVEEADGIGLRVPIELLNKLRARSLTQ
jgi:hypothetical protein